MPNELAIAVSTPTAVSATPATPADSSANNEFVTALANVLSSEGAALATTAPVTLPAVVGEDELSDLEELLDASTLIDPQALMLSLEQAQRMDAAVQPASGGNAIARSALADGAALAAMSAASTALSMDEQAAGNASALLDATRGSADFMRDAKSEGKPGTENSTAAILAANAATHERVSELSDKPVIRAHVGTASWTEQLAGKLTLMVGRGIQSASIQLSPEHLGPLEIRISVQNEQASVWFGAAHAETRTALEQALPRLRELLAGQGLNLSDAGVFRETPRQPNKAYVPSTHSSEGEREFNVAIGIRGMVDAYA